jgi:hypothetical protein
LALLADWGSPRKKTFLREIDSRHLADIGDTVFQEREVHMKAICTGLILAGLVLATGCNQSSTGGKPGEANGSFKVRGPSNVLETTVKQGETIKKDLTVEAGKNFQEDITFDAKVAPADTGVSATVEPKVWKASETKKVELSIKAADDAKQGEYAIHVMCKPAKGASTTLDVKIKVPEKKK